MKRTKNKIKNKSEKGKFDQIEIFSPNRHVGKRTLLELIFPCFPPSPPCASDGLLPIIPMKNNKYEKEQ